MSVAPFQRITAPADAGADRHILSAKEAIKAFLSLFRKPSPTPLQLARKARWEAAEDYADAKRRCDTRTVSSTLRAFHKATNEVVRLELAEHEGRGS